VGAVGDERRAVEAPAGPGADERGPPVAGEADGAGERQREEVLGLVRVQQAVDRLIAGDAGAGEDRQDDGEAGDALGLGASQREGDRQRDRGGGVAEVVDEIGEQGDAARGDEDEQLGDRGRAEDEQGEADGAQALARALDRLVDEAVAVAAGAVAV
jgi:hypothetical protein